MSDKMCFAFLCGMTVLGIHYKSQWVLILVLVVSLCWALWLAGTLLWDNARRLVRFAPHVAVTVFVQGFFAADRWAGALVCGLFLVTALFILGKEFKDREHRGEVLCVLSRLLGMIGWNMLVGLLWTTLLLTIKS